MFFAYRSDASAYNQVRFLCRPWHNVSGETNYRTAKLLLTGVFVQVSDFVWLGSVKRNLTFINETN